MEETNYIITRISAITGIPYAYLMPATYLLLFSGCIALLVIGRKHNVF